MNTNVSLSFYSSKVKYYSPGTQWAAAFRRSGFMNDVFLKVQGVQSETVRLCVKAHLFKITIFGGDFKNTQVSRHHVARGLWHWKVVNSKKPLASFFFFKEGEPESNQRLGTSGQH